MPQVACVIFPFLNNPLRNKQNIFRTLIFLNVYKITPFPQTSFHMGYLMFIKHAPFMFNHSSHMKYLTNVPIIINNLFHHPTNPIQNAMESFYNEFPLCLDSIHWIFIYYKMVMNTQGCMMLFNLIFHIVGEQLHVNFVSPCVRLIVLILSSFKRWFSHLCKNMSQTQPWTCKQNQA